MFLKDAGIKHNTSVAGCPQSNGKAERLNRTLVEKARCMLITAGLNNNLWGAAIVTANYLRNLSPSAPLNNKSPYEVYYGKLPKISHLKIFGCKAYPLDLDKNKDKFAPRSKKNCILIGYGEKEGIYWILDKKTNKAFRSRDVKFDEDLDEIAEIEISQKLQEVKSGENVRDDQDASEDEKVDNQIEVENEKVDKNEDDIDQNENDFDNQEYFSINGEENEQINSIRKSTRNKKQTNFYQSGESNVESSKQDKTSKKVNFVNFTYEEDEPQTLQQAMKSKYKDKWKEAIESEFSSLKENQTWKICELPKGKKTVKTRWIFKVKLDSNNHPDRFKARLVAKGFNQEFGVDYNETFAPVIKQQALKLCLAIAVNENLNVHQIDVSTAFLNGDLEEDVYIDPPDGFDGKIKENQVLKLNKALYGLKQAPRAWNKKLVMTFKEMGLKQCMSDNCIFFNNKLLVAVQLMI